jgi:hypothetical protein
MPSHRPPPSLAFRCRLAALLMPLAAASGGEAVISVADAGPDYAIQGEYVEGSGASPLGAQVVALGHGTFSAVLLPGGLPGAGWNGHDRLVLPGTRTGDHAQFSGSDGHGTISNGAFDVTLADGSTRHLVHTVRHSPTEGAPPPPGAQVLFDGTSTDAWNNGRIVDIDGVKALAYGAETKQKLHSYHLHVEFRTPFKPTARDQERGNSGIYIHHTYEVQILDTFGLPTNARNMGALFTVTAPLLDMSYPPLTWQTYDIDWTDPTFDAQGQKTGDAQLTVRLNGVLIQDHITVHGGTGANRTRKETPAGGPLWLQDHHNPVYFRNIWITVPQ